MDLLAKSDDEIFAIGKPFWENLVRSSNLKVYGGFTRADFTGQQNKTTATAHSVQQVSEGVAMSGAHKQVAWINRNGKRRLH